jgi:hypothetical protein
MCDNRRANGGERSARVQIPPVYLPPDKESISKVQSSSMIAGVGDRARVVIHTDVKI